jgi:hypothetical protein
MDYNEYQKQASESMMPQCNNINYLGFGLVGEFVELISAVQKNDEANIVWESGDCYWYISQISAFWMVKLRTLGSIDCYEYDYLEKLNQDVLIQKIIKQLGEFCEGIKRIIRGDGRLDDARLTNLSLIFKLLISLDVRLGYSVDTIMKLNIKKLDERMAKNTIKGKGDKR